MLQESDKQAATVVAVIASGVGLGTYGLAQPSQQHPRWPPEHSAKTHLLMPRIRSILLTMPLYMCPTAKDTLATTLPRPPLSNLLYHTSGTPAHTSRPTTTAPDASRWGQPKSSAASLQPDVSWYRPLSRIPPIQVPSTIRASSVSSGCDGAFQNTKPSPFRLARPYNQLFGFLFSCTIPRPSAAPLYDDTTDHARSPDRCAAVPRPDPPDPPDPTPPVRTLRGLQSCTRARPTDRPTLRPRANQDDRYVTISYIITKRHDTIRDPSL